MTVALVLLVPAAASAQANLEGPTGVFLNPLAYTLPAGTTQSSIHYVDLQPLGTLTTLGVTVGLPKGVEIGITREALALGGTANTDVLHLKWMAVPEKERSPAVAIGAVLRRPTGSGGSTSDFYIVATKVIPRTRPVILSANVRTTNGMGYGLLGKSDRDTEFGAFVGVVVGPKLIIGWETAGQPGGAEHWSDFCFRYTVSENTNIDGGLADLGSGLDDQIAVAFTHRF